MLPLMYFYKNIYFFLKINLVRRLAMCACLKISLISGLTEESYIPAFVLKLLNNTLSSSLWKTSLRICARMKVKKANNNLVPGPHIENNSSKAQKWESSEHILAKACWRRENLRKVDLRRFAYHTQYSVEGLAEIICCQSKIHFRSLSLLKNLWFFSDITSSCVEGVHDD